MSLMDDLERQLAEAQRQMRLSARSYKILQGYLETCQARYDHDMAEKEAEIADLKKGFIDVDEAFKT